jgi:hypothetical protein
MAIPQITFGQYYDASYAGLIADSGFHDTGSYSGSVGPIPFGFPVTLGANPDRQVKPATSAAGQGALVVGIAAASEIVEDTYPMGAGVSAYPVNETVPVFKRGRIWVMTSDAVVAGAVANLTLADGSFTDAAVAAGIEAFTNISVKFVTSTMAAGLAIVEIK